MNGSPGCSKFRLWCGEAALACWGNRLSTEILPLAGELAPLIVE